MSEHGQLLATMLTMTTYGTWLRGDARGSVEHAVLYPADPQLEEIDRARMKHPRFAFARNDLLNIGHWILDALRTRLDQSVVALTVQTWHLHFIVPTSKVPIAHVAKCAKEAVRYDLRAGRPIWTVGYDKRYCFDDAVILARIKYIECHNERMGWKTSLASPTSEF